MFGGNFVSAWAYECRARDESAARWFVSRAAINELPPGTRGVLVRVGDDWLPAVVDRSRQVAVEAMLLHDVIADEEFTGIGPEVSAESEPRTAPASLRRSRRFRSESIRLMRLLAGQICRLLAHW